MGIGSIQVSGVPMRIMIRVFGPMNKVNFETRMDVIARDSIKQEKGCEHETEQMKISFDARETNLQTIRG